MVRLFHTLQEMDYLPVREEIRERVAAMWGVTPAWQGAPEAFGGLSTQTQQLVVMSRVVESDQRLFTEKVFPYLLKALGITDYDITLPNPEEKAESTRLSMAQQKIQIVTQIAGLGFDITLKEQDVPIDAAEFIISGEPVAGVTAQMSAEQMAMGLEQQKQQMAQQEQQQEMMEDQQAMMGAEGAADEMVPEGAVEEEGEPIQAMLKSTPPSQRKFKGRTGGRTPDWHDKGPNEERDIDEYAEARSKKNELTLSSDFMTSLYNQGYTAPEIKEVSPDFSKMWFAQNGTDYVADLGPMGVTSVAKATFATPPKRQHTTPAPSIPNLDTDDAD